MDTPNLDKRLKHHDQMCKMHVYSLGDERYCSCGRNAALEELAKLTTKKVGNMSELLSLSHLLDKPESDLTPIERAIIVASAYDEDLANDAIIQYNAMAIAIEGLVGYE